MTKERSAKVTLILSVIAALFALTAAAIEWTRHDAVNIALIAAALFLLAFGFGAKNRMMR